MDLGLKDKVILITGGGEGIGAAISQACLDEGAIPCIVNRDSEAVQAFAHRLHEHGVRFELLPMELHLPQSCRQAVDEALRRCGRIDALVNNAGINDKVGLESGSPEEFLASLERNLWHYYSMAHYALPSLRAARGSIVNMASKTALTGQGGTSGYAASKGGQLALTREWAVELLPFGIRVNAIVPAEVMTPLYRRWLATFPDPDGKLRSITERIPLGRRMTEPAEIASMAVFLLSEKARHITGQHLFVDGGYVHLDRALG
ncbi:MAG TPA: SDR family oxidoreductase [Acidobacteriaceae bacterium]|nr:SDR family oxidoreductase [Acidobacteriaceae bacterium]